MRSLAMVAGPKKRPASGQAPEEGARKKPASWQDFAASQSSADDAAGPEKDSSAIAKEQRYIFDRAKNAGQLPPAVLDAHTKVKTERLPGYPKDISNVGNLLEE